MNTSSAEVRIVTWNCRGANSLKMQAIAPLCADIVVLQEVRKSELSVFADATSCAWDGDTTKSSRGGVAVIGHNGWQITQSQPSPEKWFLPVVATRGHDRLTILAVWAKDERGSYIGPTVRALNLLRDVMSTGRTVITGDFNANTAWDSTNSRSKYGFIRQLTLLKEMGFTSLWHHHRQEAHGAETVPTRYQRIKGKVDLQYFHVDYAFVSADLLATTPAELNWTIISSDHVPLSFTVAARDGS